MNKQHGQARVRCSDAFYSAQAGKKGRGVFAAKDIPRGMLIEECEVIFFPKKEISILAKTKIDCYYYCWKGGAAVLPLGFGSLYNHSHNPNAKWKDDYKNRRMVLWAAKKIKKDEEITVNYRFEAKKPWFPVVENNAS